MNAWEVFYIKAEIRKKLYKHTANIAFNKHVYASLEVGFT